MISAATGTRSLSEEGFAALRRGDARAARVLLTRVVQVDEANAAICFARAHRQLNCSIEETQALDQAFKADPHGSEVALNAQRCPATMAALREVPLCRTGQTPVVLLSLLRPGARIRPHHGFMNTRLICRMPLETRDELDRLPQRV